MTDLVIGTVARGREWIIGRWHEHAAKAAANAGLEARFLLVVDPRDPTAGELLARDPDAIIHAVHEDVIEDVRGWPKEARKRRMVELRNDLLGEVRQLGPAWFWSIDSDILAHPDALVAMLAAYQRGMFHAVGGACFMSKYTAHGGSLRDPSYLVSNRNGGYHREWKPGATGLKVDVIMANKLMSPPAYEVDYAYDSRGEDIGWSVAARAAGVRLGWSSTVVSKHVMSPAVLDVVDERCGF